jgi:MYXO-CTERM domain-containing protein
MTAHARSFRSSYLGSCLAGLVCLLLAASARAASNPTSCQNDIDCVATPQCGGDVCDYITAPIETCKPQGSQPKGGDGWCTVDSDCKCASLGAKCMTDFCTFTKPSDAPGAGSAGASGGVAGASGTGAGGSSTGGRSTGGSGPTSTGGSSSGGSSGGGGCSVGGPVSGSWSIALGLFGLFAAVRRRRSRRSA